MCFPELTNKYESDNGWIYINSFENDIKTSRGLICSTLDYEYPRNTSTLLDAMNIISKFKSEIKSMKLQSSSTHEYNNDFDYDVSYDDDYYRNPYNRDNEEVIYISEPEIDPNGDVINGGEYSYGIPDINNYEKRRKLFKEYDDYHSKM